MLHIYILCLYALIFIIAIFSNYKLGNVKFKYLQL